MMAFLDCDFQEASRKVRLKDGFAPLASYQVASGSKNLQDLPRTCVVRRLRPRLVLKPGTLREALQALELCAKAEVAVLPQGAWRWTRAQGAFLVWRGQDGEGDGGVEDAEVGVGGPQRL